MVEVSIWEVTDWFIVGDWKEVYYLKQGETGEPRLITDTSTLVISEMGTYKFYIKEYR